MLFSFLKGYNIVFDDFKVLGEIFERVDGFKLIFVQFCNILDEIMKMFLLKIDIQDRLIISGIYDRNKIRELYNSCFVVVVGWIVVFFIFDDNIFNVMFFLCWVKYVYMIILFVVLVVVLQKLFL